jgi:hypothetical protein
MVGLILVRPSNATIKRQPIFVCPNWQIQLDAGYIAQQIFIHAVEAGLPGFVCLGTEDWLTLAIPDVFPAIITLLKALPENALLWNVSALSLVSPTVCALDARRLYELSKCFLIS